jgi:HAD superfamily hydrolase (TIGR01450 family)
MKIIVENNIIKEISKKIDKQRAYGCSIDVYKIKKEDLSEIKSEMKRIIENEGDLNQWTEVMLDNLLKSKKIVMNPYNINPAKWFEIDNFDDLAAAELLFNQNISKISDKKIYFIDKDGTLILKNQKIKGTDIFLNELKKKDKIFYVITNNSSKTPIEHWINLRELGFNVTPANILVSIQSTLVFLRENGIINLFWVSTRKVSEYIENEGFIFDDKKPQALLLTYDTEINYAKLETLIYFIRKDIPYYATHIDLVCPTPIGPVPDIGTFIEIIRMTTGVLPKKTFGKPEKSLIDPILKKHKCQYKDAVVIGDRLYTDTKLAENSDLTSVLVLTGETNREDYEESRILTDIIVKDLVIFSKYI